MPGADRSLFQSATGTQGNIHLSAAHSPRSTGSRTWADVPLYGPCFDGVLLKDLSPPKLPRFQKATPIKQTATRRCLPSFRAALPCYRPNGPNSYQVPALHPPGQVSLTDLQSGYRHTSADPSLPSSPGISRIPRVLDTPRNLISELKIFFIYK